MSGYNNTVGDPSISSQINVTDPYKLTTPNGKVVMVPPPRPHGWRIPEVINPSLQSIVPMQDRNVYTYYEQLMALKRAAVAIVEEIAEMTDNLVPDITPEDANKVLAVKNDGTGLEWKRSTATGLDAEVTQTDYGAHIEIINSGVKTEADIYNGTDGTDGAQGEKGDPGYSPQVAIQQLPNGVEINVTDEHGSTSAQVINGTDGEKGDPGYSPTARVERVTGGALVTVTDEFGTTQSMVNDGQDGIVGRDGVDGVSPTASVTQLTPNSIQFEVTDANGTTSATLTGEAGQDGVDGVSPTATVTQTQNGATVTITDKNGTTTANLTNGSNGTDGVDGVSPTATVTQTQNGATVTITDKNGTTTANLTNGTDGSKGDDGFSPTASVTPTANGADITITDKNGTTSASITNGAKGDTGAGVPAGGTDGQVLVKDGNTDYATKWVDPEAAQDKQYSLDYVKDNGKWYTTLSDGQTTQRLAVPDDWTQGGGTGGNANFDIGTVPLGGSGVYEVNAILNNNDSERVSTVYSRGAEGELPDWFSLQVTSGLGTDNFEVSTRGYTEQKAAQAQDNAQTYARLGLAQKQDKLVSGTNIKSVNGSSLLGNGDLLIREGVVVIDVASPPTMTEIEDYIERTGAIVKNGAEYYTAYTYSRDDEAETFIIICLGAVDGILGSKFFWFNQTGNDSIEFDRVTDAPSTKFGTAWRNDTLYYASVRRTSNDQMLFAVYNDTPDLLDVNFRCEDPRGGTGNVQLPTKGYVDDKSGVNLEVGVEKWYGTYTENGVTYQVYSKVIKIDQLPAAAGTTTYDHGITDIKQILQVYGFCSNGFVMNAARQTASDNISVFQVSKSAGNEKISIEVGKDRSSLSAYVCLIYAKNNN